MSLCWAVFTRDASRGFDVKCGHFLTSASKFNVEPNGGIFDINTKNHGASTFTCCARIKGAFHTGAVSVKES